MRIRGGVIIFLVRHLLFNYTVIGMRVHSYAEQCFSTYYMEFCSYLLCDHLVVQQHV